MYQLREEQPLVSVRHQATDSSRHPWKHLVHLGTWTTAQLGAQLRLVSRKLVDGCCRSRLQTCLAGTNGQTCDVEGPDIRLGRQDKIKVKQSGVISVVLPPGIVAWPDSFSFVQFMIGTADRRGKSNAGTETGPLLDRTTVQATGLNEQTSRHRRW